MLHGRQVPTGSPILGKSFAGSWGKQLPEATAGGFWCQMDDMDQQLGPNDILTHHVGSSSMANDEFLADRGLIHGHTIAGAKAAAPETRNLEL